MLFDSHCHLPHAAFDESREEIIQRLQALKIEAINVGVGTREFEKAIDLAEKYPKQIWAAIGFHPHDVEGADGDFNKLKIFAANKKVVAIGECGLDYFGIADNEFGIKEKQKNIFIKQIELAKELKKPLIVHCRPSIGSMDAYEDALNILNSQFSIHNSTLGVVHFFSGSKEIAKKFLDLGFYISFAGPITFHPSGGHPRGGSSSYKEVVEFIPSNRIMAETDSPFAAPLPHRGERNEPAFVEFVVRQIAEWKGLNFDEAAQLTAENAKKLFKLP